MSNSKNRNNSILHTKSYCFALRIVKMVSFLQNDKSEYVMSKQILRSGTAIGALVRESEFAQSNANFVNKLSVSLKEANETDYWLNLLNDSEYIDDLSFKSMEDDCGELIALLISSIKTIKNNINNK